MNDIVYGRVGTPTQRALQEAVALVEGGPFAGAAAARDAYGGTLPPGLRSVEGAEDLTARVFYRALNHLPRYHHKGKPFAAWLYRIAHNLIANWHRDHNRRQMVTLENLNLSGDNQEMPHHAAERINETEILLEAIKKLPPERQKLLTFKFIERMSNAEIGRLMGRSEGAIKSLYHRTLVSLKDLLVEHENLVNGSQDEG